MDWIIQFPLSDNLASDFGEYWTYTNTEYLNQRILSECWLGERVQSSWDGLYYTSVGVVFQRGWVRSGSDGGLFEQGIVWNSVLMVD